MTSPDEPSDAVSPAAPATEPVDAEPIFAVGAEPIFAVGAEPIFAVGAEPIFAVGEEMRAAALDALVHATGKGHVSLEEFYRWTDDVLAARTRGELEAVTARFEATPVPPGRVKHHWFVPFGNRIRRGRFVLPERTHATIWMGEIHLDLRGATLVGPEPLIHLRVLMGTLRILVPRWIHVEIDQSSFFGGRTITGYGPPRSVDKPMLRVRMVDVMGNVKVTTDPAAWSPVVLPGGGP